MYLINGLSCKEAEQLIYHRPVSLHYSNTVQQKLPDNHKQVIPLTTNSKIKQHQPDPSP